MGALRLDRRSGPQHAPRPRAQGPAGPAVHAGAGGALWGLPLAFPSGPQRLVMLVTSKQRLHRVQDRPPPLILKADGACPGQLPCGQEKTTRSPSSEFGEWRPHRRVQCSSLLGFLVFAFLNLPVLSHSVLFLPHRFYSFLSLNTLTDHFLNLLYLFRRPWNRTQPSAPRGVFLLFLSLVLCAMSLFLAEAACPGTHVNTGQRLANTGGTHSSRGVKGAGDRAAAG